MPRSGIWGEREKGGGWENTMEIKSVLRRDQSEYLFLFFST